MFPDGLLGVTGVGGWLLMTGCWVGVVAGAAWALRRVLPSNDRRDGHARPGEINVEADDLRQPTTT